LNREGAHDSEILKDFEKNLPQKGAKSARGNKRSSWFFVNFALLCGRNAFQFPLLQEVDRLKGVF
jgi:hypothetical protein